MSLESLTEQSKPYTVIHIGCGEAAEWEARLTQEPNLRLVLVEPNPGYREALSRLAGWPQVNVIEAAVAGGKGDNEGEEDIARAEFSILSFEEYSTLGPVGPLQVLMPGIAVEERIVVDQLSPRALMEQVALTGDNNELIIETIGQEGAILQALSDEEHLSRFARITLRAPRTPLFEEGLGAPSLQQLLLHAGFCFIEDSEVNDPDWSTGHYRFDPGVARLERNRQIINEENARLRLEISTLKEFSQAKVKAVETRDKEAQVLQARITSLQAQVSDLQSVREALSAQVADQQARIAAQEKTQRETRAALDVAQTQLTALKARLDKQAEREDAMRDELGLAVRLQTKTSLDLEDLRFQHANALEQKSRQEDLLARLMVRLEDASQYLQQLQMSPPPDVEALPEAPAAPARKPTTRKSTASKSKTTTKRTTRSTKQSASGTRKTTSRTSGKRKTDE